MVQPVEEEPSPKGKGGRKSKGKASPKPKTPKQPKEPKARKSSKSKKSQQSPDPVDGESPEAPPKRKRGRPAGTGKKSKAKLAELAKAQAEAVAAAENEAHQRAVAGTVAAQEPAAFIEEPIVDNYVTGMEDIQLMDNQDDEFADLLNNAPEDMAQRPAEEPAFVEAIPAYDEPARDSDADDVEMAEEQPVNEE